MLGLYIHVPFCIKKCNYCDFNSYQFNEKDKIKYLEAIVNEMKMYKNTYKDKIFNSIFIGGGTPSILEPKEIELLMKNAYKNFNIDENAEVSIECNPGTITKDKLIAMKENHINRLSIGLQAYQSHHLEKLGRIHNFNQFKKNYLEAREIGFNNINIDLMYAIPNQTMTEWEDTLKAIVKLNPEHISAYSLILEEGTKFFNMYENDELQLVDEDIDIKMYEYTMNFLIEHGYHQYEISNYAKEEYECEHNKIYWRCDKYLGLGPGASGYIDNIRYSNLEKLDEYFKSIENGNYPIATKSQLENQDKLEEKIFMGLRMNEGINMDEINKEFSIDFFEKYELVINKLEKLNLIKVDNRSIKLTQKGREISNSVFIEFID